MLNIGDGQFFAKKLKEGGDFSKCTRTKNYVKNTAGLFVSGITVVLAWALCSNSAIDFFMKDLKNNNKPERRHENNNNVRQPR